MVDWPLRHRYIGLLTAYMRGEATNLDLDDLMLREIDRAPDPDLFDVAFMVWGTYDDFHAHRIPDQLVWSIYRRAIAFLLSGRLLTPVRKRRHRWIPFVSIHEPYRTYAPFDSQGDWLAARSLLETYGIPAIPPASVPFNLTSLKGRRAYRARLRRFETEGRR